MKSKSLTIVLLAISFCVFAVANASESVIKNGSFEDKLKGWGFENSNSSLTKVVKDPDGAHSGKYYVRIEKEKGEKWSYLWQRPYSGTDMPWGSHLRASAWVRIDKIKKAKYFKKAMLRVKLVDKENNDLIYETSTMITETDGWEQLALDIDIPDKKKMKNLFAISFSVQVVGDKKSDQVVCFDDVSMSITPN